MEHGERQLAGGSGQLTVSRTQRSEVGSRSSEDRRQLFNFGLRISDIEYRITSYPVYRLRFTVYDFYDLNNLNDLNDFKDLNDFDQPSLFLTNA